MTPVTIKFKAEDDGLRQEKLKSYGSAMADTESRL